MIAQPDCSALTPKQRKGRVEGERKEAGRRLQMTDPLLSNRYL
jgi:hypothetical protein